MGLRFKHFTLIQIIQFCTDHVFFLRHFLCRFPRFPELMANIMVPSQIRVSLLLGLMLFHSFDISWWFSCSGIVVCCEPCLFNWKIGFQSGLESCLRHPFRFRMLPPIWVAQHFRISRDCNVGLGENYLWFDASKLTRLWLVWSMLTCSLFTVQIFFEHMLDWSLAKWLLVYNMRF